MTDNSITIVTVNWYSGEYLQCLFESLERKSSGNSTLNFLIIDNTDGQDAGLGTLKTSSDIRVLPNNAGTAKGSLAHALGLNLALKNIHTRYALFVDPDVYVLKNNWDEFLITVLKEQNAVAVGSAFPRWQLGKYHDFPNPVFCFADLAEYGRLQPDWTPFEEDKAMRLWDFLRRNILRLGLIINRRTYEKSKLIRTIWTRLEQMMGVCSKDTGWRIARKALERNCKSVTFDVALYHEFSKNSKFHEIAKEYELYCHKDEPILIHKYSTNSILWKSEKGNDRHLWLKTMSSMK